jgi:hypothetical protein
MANNEKTGNKAGKAAQGRAHRKGQQDRRGIGAVAAPGQEERQIARAGGTRRGGVSRRPLEWLHRQHRLQSVPIRR